jgi:hypothetical protein
MKGRNKYHPEMPFHRLCLKVCLPVKKKKAHFYFLFQDQRVNIFYT